MGRKIVIAGGSGALGRTLAPRWSRAGHDVVVLSRRPGSPGAPFRTVVWDGATLGPWAEELDGADVLVNLAGRSVDCRYTARNRREILTSRVESTRVLGEAIARAKGPPAVWLNSSSATYYRSTRDAPHDEATGRVGDGSDFSEGVCKAWEWTFAEAHAPGTRKVALRSAIVLTPTGGAFPVLRRLAFLGLGGHHGDGSQFASWVHVEDFARALEFLMESDLAGVVNVASPNPVPEREFMAALRAAVGVRFRFPLPRWMLEFGAFFLRTETELVLKSRRVVPGRLLEAGFRFRHPEIRGAFAELAGADRGRGEGARTAPLTV